MFVKRLDNEGPLRGRGQLAVGWGTSSHSVPFKRVRHRRMASKQRHWNHPLPQALRRARDLPTHPALDDRSNHSGHLTDHRGILNTHKSVLMRRLIAARECLTVFHLPTTAPELNPVEDVWAAMKSGLVNLVKREIDQLRDIVKHRLRRMQHQPELLAGLLVKTGLDPRPP